MTTEAFQAETESQTTPMAVYRKEWPKIRGELVNGTEYFRVDLRRAGYVGPKKKTFTNLAEAKKFASETAAKVRDTGLSSLVQNLDPRLARWQEQANLVGLSLDDVFSLGLKAAHDHKAKAASPVMESLLTAWVTSKEQNQLKPLRADSIRSLNGMAKAFKAAFGHKKIVEITRPVVVEYLNGLDCSNRYRDNLRNYLGQFFFWAIKEGHAKENPAKGIEIDRTKLAAPVYYSVDLCKDIMREAMTKPEVACYFSLCLFCGIRPTECERLQWWDEEAKWGVNVEKGYIVIPAWVAKTKCARQFDIPKNCVEWLKTFKEEGKQLIPKNFVRARNSVKSKFNGKLEHDGMRHTYCTFAYAVHHSLSELTHVMGNSPEVINSFYKGLIGENDVQAFWNMTPESLKAEAK